MSYSSKMSHKGDKRTNNVSSEWKRCLGAARWIPCTFDMYCNLEETIRVSQIVKDAEQNGDDNSDDENNIRLKTAYKRIVETLDANTILRHMSVYQYLQQETPYLMDLIRNKDHQTRVALIHEMQNTINRTHSDDASHLRPVIGSYVAPDPERKALDPPVQPGTTKDRLGFNHPELACLLYPIRHLQEMLDDPVKTRKRITCRNIKVTAQKNPAFLYEGDIAGKNFDPEDVASGFMRGYLVERVMKHIFMSPSSALSTSKTHNTRSSNSKLHNMRQVAANHIAYAATHARFSICSQAKFVDLDVDFKLPDFYYRIATFIADEISEDWSNDLYTHYNKLLFGNPRRLGCATDDADEPSDKDDITIMKKQMANRASGLSSRFRASTVVEELMSPAHHTDFNADDLYNNPTAVVEDVSVARHADAARSQSRSSTAVEATMHATSDMEVDADHDDDANQELDRAQEPTAPVLANISKKPRSHPSSAWHNTAPVARTLKAKSKVIEYDDDDDSPLTDVEEDASAGKK